MKILVKLPTKKRKEKFFSTLDIFYNLLDDIENTAFLITLDDDDDDMVNDEVLNKLTGYKNLSYTVGKSIHKLSATNRDLEKFNDWDILVLASWVGGPCCSTLTTLLFESNFVTILPINMK